MGGTEAAHLEVQLKVRDLIKQLQKANLNLDVEICVKPLVSPKYALNYLYNIESAKVWGPSGISAESFVIATDLEGFML